MVHDNCGKTQYKGFSEAPSNNKLLIGSNTEAVFRCHHEFAELVINWEINGSVDMHLAVFWCHRLCKYSQYSFYSQFLVKLL